MRLTPVLRDMGVETVVLLPEEEGNAAPRLAAAGIEVVTRPFRRLRAVLDPRIQWRFLRSLARDIREIERVIDERSIDLVQVTGLMNPHAAIAARRARVPVVWQLLDTRPPAAARRVMSPVVRALADVVMSTGREVARVHPGIEGLGERLVPFYPPVDTALFRPDVQAARAAREQLGVDGDGPVLGTVGNLNPQKGHEHLLDAAALVRRSFPELRVRVLGAHTPTHSEYADALRRRAAALGLEDGSAIRFVDPGDRVPELVQAFDVFALTSVPRSEGIPTAVLEAMACGIPVVATDVGGVREVVEPGETGALVEPLKPEAIAAALEHILGDPAAQERFGACARRRAVERYGLEACARTHVHAYELALSRRR
jgi:glycosyltransferase involved in cell wall biosynthesis